MDARRQALMRRSMGGMAGMPGMSAHPDRAFLEMMTPHHASANEMANVALQNSQSERVLGLAQRIITAQADEMHHFKDWLRTHR